MNYTESFDQFASRVSSMDLALYAGIGLILWVLFKDRLSPVQKFLSDTIANFKDKSDSVLLPSAPSSAPVVTLPKVNKDDVFFKLVSSWKQTRDLAVLSKCEEAVKVADQMFPFLSPNVCSDKEVTEVQNKNRG